MRRLGAILLLAAVAATVGLSAHANAAARLPRKSDPVPPTTDVAYTCPVQTAKFVSIYAGVKLPAGHNNPSPGALNLDTGIETKTVNGVTTTKTQASVVPASDGVTIDTKNCKKAKRIPFSPKGLPSTLRATASFRGYVDQACKTASKVVFRLQVHSLAGTPTSAVLAVRNANAKSKPIALVYWNQKRVRAHLEHACSNLSP